MYGCFGGDVLIGIIALIFGFNPDYETIEGHWEYPSGDKDLTIHRIAVKDGYHGKK